jgi:serine/threonine-protein kinase
MSQTLQDQEAEERRANLGRALKVGVVVWPAFGLMDLWVCTMVDPATSLAFLLLWRGLGAVLLFVYFGLLTRTSSLPTTAFEWLTFQTTTIFISIMATDYGGLNSPYISGVTVVVVVHAFTMTSRWQRALFMTSATALAFPATMGVAAVFRADIAAQWHDLGSLAEFVQDFLFLYGVVIVGSIISHQLWAAHRQVFEARKLGRYRLRKQIGAGGMGQVWLARDEHKNRDVALKLLVLDKDITKNSALRTRFEREARAMAKLKSLHTIRIYDVGSSEDAIWYIAMEHLDGQDLREYVRRGGPVDAVAAANILLQICASLREAHREGIIHRDVKPSNLFVTDKADSAVHVTLLDFGIARSIYDDKTELTHGIVGTPGYIAPEAFRGMPPAEPMDVYSLGGVGYFLMTGRSPGPLTQNASPGDTTVDRRGGSKREHDRFGMGSSAVPEPLASVIAKCLAPNPVDRYQSVDEVAEALMR